jgi:3'(2'),5'-bisphosphate nucleotidase
MAEKFSMNSAEPSLFMTSLLNLAIDAGRAIMAIYAGDAETRWKHDATPVTAADLAAENIILAGLARLAPDIPVISEESAYLNGNTSKPGIFFLVDPLDGTKEFLSRNGEFTVNIALVENSSPVAGVILAPAKARLFWGETGQGAFESALAADFTIAGPPFRRLSALPVPAHRLRVVASRSHRDAETEVWLNSCDVGELLCAGSSLKFCLLAAGEADIYPRFGRTMEWDTAAGHAILSAAGGKVLTLHGTPLTYGKPSFANPSFIARGA